MVEQLRKIGERVGQYKPLGGNDPEATRLDFPLEVQRRMVKLAMEGKMVILDSTTTVDESGDKVTEVRETYYDLKRPTSE